MTIEEKFAKLGVDGAPGQECRQMNEQTVINSGTESSSVCGAVYDVPRNATYYVSCNAACGATYDVTCDVSCDAVCDAPSNAVCDAPSDAVCDASSDAVCDASSDASRDSPVDFSHGDVDAFTPIPGAFDEFTAAVREGGAHAYTEYRGRRDIREELAVKLSNFTGAQILPDDLILTPGTQGALFLAMGACVAHGDKVAIVEPDYFANRKMTVFLEGTILPVRMNFENASGLAGLDLDALEGAFRSGAKVFLFSNPNNPVGAIYAKEELQAIASLAMRYGVTVIVDELYARQVFDGRKFHHLCAMSERPENLVTVIGPSKTESLSGYRIGAAYGTSAIIERMEKLQAIVSLRCPGYAQGVFRSWFNEPPGWLEERIKLHQNLRDDLLKLLNNAKDIYVRPTEGGSYMFIRFLKMKIQVTEFIRLLRPLGVTVTHGAEFGPGFSDWIRINFSQNHAATLNAIRLILNLCERHR